MQAIIEKIELTNFKGCRNATYEFGEKSNSVLGQNGAGKSTIVAAWYWVFANCDSDLHSNPAIFPLDVEECTPTVRIYLNCDGKSVEVAKMQKRTIKKSKTGGADTVSLSNSYEVNSVEYGERDFKKKMTEYGFDFDLFLPLSHSDVFTSQKSADMRKVLFGMASEKSDYEIATNSDEIEKKWKSMSEEDKENWTYEEFFDYEVSMSLTSDVALLLKNYTAEEVKAMQNATLRKIREEYGKDGEILRAKIEGMEQSKTDIDVAELELHRNALKEKISENKAKQEDISREFEEQQKGSDGILELKFELNDLQRKANEDLDTQRRALSLQIGSLQSGIAELERKIRSNRGDIKTLKNCIEMNETNRKIQLKKWNEANERVFDENSLICQFCGQEFPAEKKEQLQAEFESHKADEIATINKNGMNLKSEIEEDTKKIKELEVTISKDEEKKAALEKNLSDLEKKYEALPQSIDISDRPEVQEIKRQIAEKEQAMKKGNSAEKIRQQLKAEVEDLQSQLTEVEKQLALAQHNVEIDEQIADLRKKQGEFEQNKANAEKILYQLDLVSRKKNTLLQDDVNSHFELVDFKLFDWLKNGEYKEVCVPQFKGKDMGVSTNTGLEILMKLDIIRGLQSFYNMHLPVFIDGAEALSESTAKIIKMDCQSVFLKVTEDENLKVEVME